MKHDRKWIKILEADQGSEWTNEFQKLCKENDIQLTLFNVQENKHNTAIVERLNKTIRDMITEYQTAYKTKIFYNVYDKIVKNYNSRINRWIRMAPKDVQKADEQEIYDNKYDKYIEIKTKIADNFKIGDKVRILKQRKINEVFAKGWKNKYSEKIYTIVEKELNGNKFKIKDDNNKTKLVYPYQIKKINDIIENPFIDENVQEQKYKKEKKQIKTEKKKKQQSRKLNAIF